MFNRYITATARNIFRVTILDRHLGGVIVQYTLITMLVLLGLFTFINFLEQLGDLAAGDFGVLDAAAYTALAMPQTVYELFPLAVLLGTIIGLSLLAADSELTALRAAGVSVTRIAGAALKVGAVFVVVAIVVGEYLAPLAESQATRNRAEHAADNGLWMRDGRAYINVGGVAPDLTLSRIKIFSFDDDNKLRALIAADNAQFADGEWTLNEIVETRIADDDITIVRDKTRRWQTEVTPKILQAFLLKPDQLSATHLTKYIRHLAENRQQAAPYQLAFWQKLTLPLSTALMVILAIPFVFTNLRSGALGRNLFTGIMLALTFYAANKAFGYLTLAYELPPLLGATAPMLAFLMLAVWMMRRVE